MFKGLPHIGDVGSRVLYNEGFRSITEVAEVDPEDLARVLEIEKEKAGEIVERAQGMVAKEEGAEPAQEGPPLSQEPAMDPVERMEGVGEKTAEILKTNGFKTVQDVLKSNVEVLSSLPGIGTKKAEKLIQSAQHYAEENKT
jgi:ERCC4-type nuclease